jgi:hypothetical protein
MESIKDLSELKVGEKVHYKPKHFTSSQQSPQNGMVKSIPEHSNEFVFVVYDCNNDWENFQKYTGQGTNLKDLHPGWQPVFKSADSNSVTMEIDGVEVVFEKVDVAEKIEQSENWFMDGYTGTEKTHQAIASFSIGSDDFEEITEIETFNQTI